MAKINKVTTNGTTYELQDYDLNDSLSKIVGIVKSNQGSLSNAVAGIDYDYPVLKGKNAPTTSTVGAIGQHYLNTSATKAPYEWVCVKISGSTYTWVEVGNGAGGINSNLLDNWYFANAVNNRGQMEYKASGYTIDRWKLSASGSTLAIADDYINFTVVSSGQSLNQPLQWEELRDKTVTASMLLATGAPARICLVIAGDTTVQSAYISSGIASITTAIPKNATSVSVAIQGNTVNSAIKIIAAKLELGTQQTLAHQDADGNWVLNEIPDYNEQLFRCCMRGADSSDAYANGRLRVSSVNPQISVVDSDSNAQGALWQTNNQTVLSNRNVSESTANHRSLVINNSAHTTDLYGALQLYTATNSTPEWYPILHTGNTNRTKLVSTETEPENSGEIYWVYK